MKHLLTIAVMTALSSWAVAAVKVGTPAPDFSVADANGTVHKLANFKGKNVVIEWYNKDCPFVRKHYDSKNMQKIQADAAAKGFVWLTVVSSLEGKQGHLTATDAKAQYEKEGSKATAILLDNNAAMGKAYEAKTTPHMYLVDAKGVLRYNGAIDSNDSADSKTITGAENYVVAAMTAVAKNEKVAKETTKPYGCGVKF